MSPSVGARFPVMSFRSVDLPAPLRPMIPSRSPSFSSKSMPRSAQNSRKRVVRHGMSRWSPSASTRLSPRDEKILYIFPTSAKRMTVRASDIVDDHSLRTVEKPSSQEEHRYRHDDEDDRVGETRPDSEHDHLLVCDDEVREWVEGEQNAQARRNHVRCERDRRNNEHDHE